MRFPDPVRSLVRTVSWNLNSYYVDLIKRLFPNAKIIIDRFHIVQMLNRAVNSMRTDLVNRFDHSSKNYRLFKRNWKLFLKRYDDLNYTHQFYERSQRKWVTSERLVAQGLELADQNFRKAYWDHQRPLSWKYSNSVLTKYTKSAQVLAITSLKLTKYYWRSLLICLLLSQL